GKPDSYPYLLPHLRLWDTPLIGRRSLDVIDDEYRDRRCCCFELQAKLLRQSTGQGWAIGIGRHFLIASRGCIHIRRPLQVNIEFATEPCSVYDDVVDLSAKKIPNHPEGSKET